MTSTKSTLHLFPIFILALLGLVMASCNQGVCLTKKQFLDHFESFIEEAETTLKDSEDKTLRLEFEDRYKVIVNDCYKTHVEGLSLKEKQDFWKKSVAFYIKGNSNFLEMKIGSVNDEAFNTYIQDQIELVIKDSGEDFGKIIQEIITDNLSPGFEELMKGLENMGKELKEALGN